MDNEISKLSHKLKNFVDLEIEKIADDFNKKLELKRNKLYDKISIIFESHMT
jgi:hypothetical protein